MNKEEKEKFEEYVKQLLALRVPFGSSVPAIMLSANLEGWIEQLAARITSEIKNY